MTGYLNEPRSKRAPEKHLISDYHFSILLLVTVTFYGVWKGNTGHCHAALLGSGDILGIGATATLHICPGGWLLVSFRIFTSLCLQAFYGSVLPVNFTVIFLFLFVHAKSFLVSFSAVFSKSEKAHPSSFVCLSLFRFSFSWPRWAGCDPARVGYLGNVGCGK